MKIPNFESLLNKFKATSEIDEIVYSIVVDEIQRKEISKGLWAKAFSKSEGNEQKAKAIYIQLRADVIKAELPELIARAKHKEKFEVLEKKRQNHLDSINQIEKSIAENLAKEKKIRGEQSKLMVYWNRKNNIILFSLLIGIVIAIFLTIYTHSVFSFFIPLILGLILGIVISNSNVKLRTKVKEYKKVQTDLWNVEVDSAKHQRLLTEDRSSLQEINKQIEKLSKKI
jgi:hypothetical protein